jgi:hypothetical protein
MTRSTSWPSPRSPVSIADIHASRYERSCVCAVTAEFGARPGRVRDAVAAASLDWRRLVTRTITDARQVGHLAEDTDADQLAFELIAFLETANATSLLHDDPNAYQRGRTAIRKHLDAAASADPANAV